MTVGPRPQSAGGRGRYRVRIYGSEKCYQGPSVVCRSACPQAMLLIATGRQRRWPSST